MCILGLNPCSGSLGLDTTIVVSYGLSYRSLDHSCNRGACFDPLFRCGNPRDFPSFRAIASFNRHQTMAHCLGLCSSTGALSPGAAEVIQRSSDRPRVLGLFGSLPLVYLLLLVVIQLLRCSRRWMSISPAFNVIMLELIATILRVLVIDSYNI